MPLVDVEDAEPTGLTPQIDVVPQTTGNAAPFSRLLDAALRRENSIGSVAERLSYGGSSPYDPSYDPFQSIKGYEDYAASFVDANSDADVARVKERIDSERRRAQMLSDGGFMGVLAEVTAGFADPINLVPIGGELAVTGRAGYRAGVAALRGFRAATLATTAQEAILQATQETRTAAESVEKIAASALIGGVLGGSVGLVFGQGGDAAFKAMTKGAMQESDVVAREMGGSVGAAGADQSTLAGNTLSGGRAIGAMAEAFPNTRVQTSPALEARQIGQQLVDVPLEFRKNTEGVETASSVESLVRQHQYPLAVALTRADDLFVQYRLGRARRIGDIAATETRDVLSATPDGKLTRKQFMEEVGKAMRAGDQHAIPEVAMAAQEMRRTVFDPLKNAAIEAGLLPADVDPGTAASYLMRVYDREKIVARRPEFVDRVARWYGDEQVKKAKVQKDVEFLAGERDRLQSDISALEARIAGRETTLGKVEARQEEARLMNEYAFKRSERMSEPLDVLRGRIREVEARTAPQLEQLSQLADRIKAERDKFPEIKDADALIFRLIGAAKRLRESKELIDEIEAASEYASAIDDTIAGFRGGIREASAAAKQARQETPGAEQLVALEKARADLKKTIKPYLKELRRLRGDLAEERGSKIQRAQGGAAFETKIRSRGNALADQASGKAHAIEDLQVKLKSRQAALDRVRNDMEQQVLLWEGKSAQAGKSAIARRQTKDIYRPGEMDRLREADTAVDDAVRRIIAANTRLERGDLLDLAEQTTDRILGTPDGRLPYDTQTPAPESFIKNTDERRGPLASRVFMIPDALIEDFLESDAGVVAKLYTRSLAPDVELAKRFGRVDMQDQIEQIRQAYTLVRSGVNDPKQLKALQERMDRDIRDIAAMRDRLRHVYMLPADPNSMAVRAARVVKDLNYLRLLGGMTLSALPDMGRIVMQHGLTRVFGDGIAPLVQSLKQFRLAAEEVKRSGVALDLVLDSRSMAIADILDDYGRGSAFERTVKGAAEKFGIVTLMAPWNAAMKQFAGVVSQTRSLKAIEKLMAGTIKDPDRARLAQFGIGDAMARRIGREFQAHGKKDGGAWWANTGDWTDLEAARIYRAALSKEIEAVIVTPGQEKWLWMSRPLGSIIGQFRSFSLSATQRILMTGMQQRDMATLNGAVMMAGLGMLAYYLKGDPDKVAKADVATWIREGIDRSGLTGIIFDANNIIEKATRGAIGVSRLTGGPVMTRYASRSATEAIVGPSLGLIGDILGLTGTAALHLTGKAEQPATAQDIHAGRRMLPFQNLIGWKNLLDLAESGVNSALGIPERRPRDAR